MRILFRFGSVLLLVPAFCGGAAFGQVDAEPTPRPVSTTKDATIPPSAAAASPTALAPQKTGSTAAALAPETPIVVLHGICDGSAVSKTTASKSKTPAKSLRAKTKDCQTVITKAQMDATLDLLLPGASPEVRRGFALNYIRMLAAASVAKEKRLYHDPAVAKELEARTEFTRMQVMASSLYHRIEKLAEEVQDSELQSYYSEHEADFQQGEVQRVVLSKASSIGSAADLAGLRAKAEELRARAAQGEEFDALHKEAVQAANSGATAGAVKTATVRRSTLPPAEAVVFNLKPGEITPVLETSGAFEFLKLISSKTVPLEAIREDLKTALANGHLQLLMKDATQGVTANFNLSYLELPRTPELFLPPSPRGPAGAKGGANAGMGADGRPAAAMGVPRQNPVVAPAAQQPAVHQQR